MRRTGNPGLEGPGGYEAVAQAMREAYPKTALLREVMASRARHPVAEQPWTHLVHVEINSLLNRADVARRKGLPEGGAALEWCAKALLAAVKNG